MFSKKSLLILATALLAAFTQAAPTSDNSIINGLKNANSDDINALGTLLAGGVNSVIYLSQNSKSDQTSTLKDFQNDISQNIDDIKSAKGDVPPQLEGAYSSLQKYVKNYKAPSTPTKQHKRTYDPNAVQTHQTGIVGNSEGTQMIAPLANDINGLLQSNSAAGSIYKGFDSVDQQADAGAAGIGNFLAPVTLGASTGVSNFLTGPVVQSLTHGTYDTIAHLVGSPVDAVLGNSELSPSDQLAQAQQQAQQAGQAVAKQQAQQAQQGQAKQQQAKQN